MAKKKRFEVQDGETIEECLERIQKEGFAPVGRREEPVFQEVKQNGKIENIPVKQKIIFEARPQ
ncbi:MULTISPECIES: NETI motif-containing protein [Salibacterium]|uniref:NETI protein n=2 Tax=Salibacterium TaxID=1884429 RepID=A0A1I4NEN9_9BACI|nr:NETI motif-containing protein [Salibacterium qingdaonense]SFM13673.1 NETI protein [Salibacterium qingdaonense]